MTEELFGKSSAADAVLADAVATLAKREALRDGLG